MKNSDKKCLADYGSAAPNLRAATIPSPANQPIKVPSFEEGFSRFPSPKMYIENTKLVTSSTEKQKIDRKKRNSIKT